ncbi:MAG: acyl-CoA dehydrogenase family protein [Betaproteobacteria bacterium]|nr:acyl-CoA dehydrogenase family protein [Betaproteobacteria bacterium]
MYNLHLTAEQLEFRDTLRDFVEREIKPAALRPARLEPFEKPLLKDLLDQASQMGLRTLSLSEEAGGSGADTLTSCIVLEELASGDVDLAVALGQTAILGRALFDEAMTSEQRKRFGKQFAEDDQYHLALAGRDGGTDIGWCYHRPLAEETGNEPVAVKQGNDWVVNGSIAFVSNAPIAKLIVVQVRTDPKKTGMNGVSTLLVPRDAPGLTVGAPTGPFGASGTQVNWRHGTGSEVVFKDCKVPAENLVGKQGQTPLASPTHVARGAVGMAAINLGVGRAAFETAVDYAKMRQQGGRNIVEHQAIGTKLADVAVKLEVARNMVWKAAWVADHPEAVADRSVSDLPLHVVARTFTAEAMHRAALEAAECFGAMAVMRDMPLQKYVHDTLVLLHYADNDSASSLQIAEAIAGYERGKAA